MKTEGEARGFNLPEGMLMNDKIMFDRFYCINSAKHFENEEHIGALYFITSLHFPTRVRFLKTDSGPVQILIYSDTQILMILNVLCEAPGNKHN